jgi:uncharacterized protein (TIGR02246 family)
MSNFRQYCCLALVGVVSLALCPAADVRAQHTPFVVQVPPSSMSSTEGIRAVLEGQVAAWNRGDIASFMAGYENASTTTFVGASVVRGWQQVLERYQQRYANREQMGTLRFAELDIRPLGAEYAAAVGRWQLERTKEAGGPVNGYFSLVLRRTDGGWKIVLDHTS